MAIHLEGANILKQEDGTYQLVLQQPCTTADREKFNAEACFAFQKLLMLATRGENPVEVWWMHNGIRCTTAWIRDPAGAWGRFTEVNAEHPN